jgi:hypothetical protein
MAPLAPPTIDDLGVRGSLCLAALLHGQDGRLPIAATHRSTLAVLELLREFGIIEVPWPEPRWLVKPDALDTPMEGLQWRYAWAAYPRANLPVALEDYLGCVPRDDYGLACRLQLWEELAVAEAESFFEQQLAKHRFDPGWARDLVFIHRQTTALLTIAQWRYCVWAAVRQGGALAQQQHAPDLPLIREAIFAEVRRRVGYVAGGQWERCALPPFQRLPRSALSRLFVTQLARPDLDFWMTPPTLSGLMYKSTVAARG